MLKINILEILCKLGIHEWIYVGAGANVFTRRFCKRCKRHEKFNDGTYYRVRDIAISEIYKDYEEKDGH